MKLYTKRGDDGSTSLIGGQRVPKSDLHVVACGELDETNAAIGLAVGACDDDETVKLLQRIQSELFTLGAQFATQGGDQPGPSISDVQVAQLETWIDEASAEVAALKSFVLPGGSEPAARLHFARAICRRAERAAVTLERQQAIDRPALAYLNRLSDLLFALARRANQRAGIADIPWKSPDS